MTVILEMKKILGVMMIAKGFYLLLYSIALRTLLL